MQPKKRLEKTKNESIKNNKKVPESVTDSLKAINYHIEFYKHQNEQYAKDINDFDHKTCVLVI